MADVTETMEWGSCWLDAGPLPDAIAADVRQATGGVVPGWARRLARVPWVVRSFARFVDRRVAFMPPGLWDLISLVVSQDNSCRYCYGAMRTMLKIQGYSDAAIDGLERDVHLAEISPAEQAALRFARKVSQANPRPVAADRDTLERVGFSPPAIAEIAYTAAFQGYPNRLATLFAMPTEAFARFGDSVLLRLVRPFIAGRFRAKPQPAIVPPPNDGPCAEVVAALGASPTARAVRTSIDEALASPVLPRRTKLLILGVIGRALGCVRAEAEARGALAAEGFGAADIEGVLANLDSPKLDARERLLVPFARETVRYRTGAIQERTRALGETLSGEEVIEAVGITALANSVGRLSILLETC